MDCGTVYRPGAYFIRVIEATTGFSFKKGGSTFPAEKKPTADPWCSLSVLQGMYSHLKVEPLWERYRELRPGADLDNYRIFLQLHADEVWATKPHMRR